MKQLLLNIFNMLNAITLSLQLILSLTDQTKEKFELKKQKISKYILIIIIV